MRIKQEVLEKVKESPACRKRIREALSVSEPTMTRYLQDNSDNLTKAAAVKSIGAYFNLTPEEILEQPKKIKKYKKPSA